MSAPKIAMVSCLNHREEFAAAYDVHLRTWRSIDPSTSLSVDEPVTKRPLVLIDPAAIMAKGTFDPRFLADDSLPSVLTNTANHLDENDDVPVWVAVLRALAKACAPDPQKPDEPTGRYAVVVDADGVEWQRKEVDGLWCSQNERTVNGYIDAHWRSYADIAVVRVLSEGVPA